MSEYHVGCGILGIYAGRLNKSKTLWLNKSDVTDEAISAVALYLLTEEKEMIFKFNNEEYVLRVTKKEGKEKTDAHINL